MHLRYIIDQYENYEIRNKDYYGSALKETEVELSKKICTIVLVHPVDFFIYINIKNSEMNIF